MFALLIKDIDVSVATFPTMLSISFAVSTRQRPKGPLTSVLPSLFTDNLSSKSHKRSELIWKVMPKRKTGGHVQYQITRHHNSKTQYFRLFDSSGTNKIRSIFVITVVHREASSDDRCFQGQTPYAINHSDFYFVLISNHKFCK